MCSSDLDFFIYETVALRPIDGGAQARAAIPTGFLDPNGGAITRMFIYDWDGIPAGTTTTLNDRFNETDGNNLGLGFHVSTIDTVYLYYYNSAGIRNLKIKYTVQPPSGYKLKDGYVYSSTDPAGKRNWQNNHTFSSGDLGAFSAALNREYFVTPIWAPINSTITLANLGDAQLPEGFSGSTRTYTESTKNLTVGAPKTNKTGHKFVGWKVSLTPQADWKQSCNIAAAYAKDGKGDGKEYTQFSVAG